MNRLARLHEPERNEDKKPASEMMLNRLLKIRSLFISDIVTKEMADTFMKQLLILADDSDGPIDIFIDSPGGDADAGFGIFDLIRFVPNRVRTISVGLTASAGTIILLAAEKGDRYSLANSRILIHQPSSGIRGTATDISIQAEEIRKLKERGNELIARETGQPIEKVVQDTERDFWMSPQEAKTYGIIDHIITSKSELK
ncbi:ATP-dependent Clp protease proteolytic subunit [bacterium]|nr:ATP-dependent Clp protease proteolytic subunit [bacterium]